MSLTSSIILRQCYVRIGAWLGDSSQINAQYNADANFEQIVSESFPAQSMWDILTGVENEIATAVASDQDSVLRSSIQDIVTVTSGNRIPATGDSGGSIIGVWGQVRDADSGLELTPGLDEDEIRAISQHPTLYKTAYYSYVLRPPRIYATVTNVEIDVCTFDYTDRAEDIAANETLLFPMAQNAYFYGVMSNISNEDQNYNALANLYKPLYAEWLASQQSKRPVVAEAAA